MPLYRYTTSQEVMSTSKPLINSLALNFSVVEHEKFKAKFGVRVDICTKVWNMIVLKLNKQSSSPMAGFGCLSVIHILYGLFLTNVPNITPGHCNFGKTGWA